MSVERLTRLPEGTLSDVAEAFLSTISSELRTPEVSVATRNFFKSIDVPQQYSWIGLYALTDDVEHDRMAIYLLETQEYVRGEINPCDQADVVPALSELYAALVPCIYVDLQPLKPDRSESPGKRAMASLMQKSRSGGGSSEPIVVVERELGTRS